MSMPTFNQRQYLPTALLGLALGLCGLGAATAGAAASTTSIADQSDTANGQPLPEVTVIGKMDARTLNHVVNQFIQSHAKPSAVISQIGRWSQEVCPAVFGLRSIYAETVVNRITSVSRAVGVPTKAERRKCTVNIDVIFTPEPQAQLDFIAGKYRSLLGYYPLKEVKQATTFARPIQAWYEIGTRSGDYQPIPKVPQDGRNAGPGNGGEGEAGQNFTTGLVIDSPESAGESGNGMGPSGMAGSYLTHGLSSEFVHVLIIVDVKKVAGYPLPTVSDYIALLALTHIASLDSCSQLPSILNLFANDCLSPPSAMTASDTAYLKALYRANLDKNLNIEQGDIRLNMVDAISKK
jgi:hypothetical protein